MKFNLPILFLSYLLILLGCKTQENVPVKENPPTVLTRAASDISLFNSTLNGEVIDEGFTAVTDRGFVYSDKNTNPLVNDTKVQSGQGKGVYSVKVDKLALNTKYYFKAYSTNTKGTSYGEVQNYTTSDYKIPTVTTDAPVNTTFYSADLGGSVTDAGGSTITQRGICYGLNSNPTTSDNKVISGEGLGVFKISLQNLKDNSKYYVRAYAINSKGTAYGNEQTFSTLNAPATPRDNTTKVVEVKSKTGRIWMDRNLGATQAAMSQIDEKAYGDLYQWGRGRDGHQLRNSKTSTTESSTDTPGNANFIIQNRYSSDWRNPQNENLWQGVNGVNNPCPNGYRLPTATEWNLEKASWSSNNSEGAFASPLKLTLAGWREFTGDGRLESSGKAGFGNYWSSTATGPNPRLLISSAVLNFRSSFTETPTYISQSVRGMGYTVRCIKD